MRYARLSAQVDGAAYPCRAQGACAPHCCGYRKSHPGWRSCRDGLSSFRDDRPLEAARRIARRSVQIACGSRSRDGISPASACCLEAVGASEAQAGRCRSRDLRLTLSAVPFLARSRGCLLADIGGTPGKAYTEETELLAFDCYLEWSTLPRRP